MSIKSITFILLITIIIGFFVIESLVIWQYSLTSSALEQKIEYELTNIGSLKSNKIQKYYNTLRINLLSLAEKDVIIKAMESFNKDYLSFIPNNKEEEIQKKDFKNFLVEQIIPILHEHEINVSPEKLISNNPKTLALQDLYIVKNNNPISEKENFLTSPLDHSGYSKTHALFHPFLFSLLQQFDVQDLLLINPDNTVVYSVKKEIDFAVNLFSEEWKNSELTHFLIKIKGISDRGVIKKSDFAFYIPALGEARAFLGASIYKENDLIGYLIFKISLKNINEIMAENEGEAFNLKTQNSYLIGSDLLMRSNSTAFLKNPKEYLENLEKAGIDPEIIKKIKIYQSTALIEKVDYPEVAQGLAGLQGSEIVKNALGNEIILHFSNVDLDDFTWASINQVHKREIIYGALMIALQLSLIGGIIFILILVFSLYVQRKIVSRLENLVEATDRFAEGAFDTKILNLPKDEFGRLGYSFNRMASSLASYSREMESKVNERTQELALKLKELQTMQQQIIVQEKLASLGALTAGIAHEIKNPLNFIINFSMLSSDLLDTLKISIDKYIETFSKEDQLQIKDTLKTLKENFEAIDSSGKRTDNIVQRMLGHARITPGNLAPTNINSLLNDNINLAYYGIQASYQYMTAKIIKNLDTTLPDIDIVAEDLSRVFLNILSNAFYEVFNKKIQMHDDKYIPTIEVTTKKENGMVKISIKDNGRGIHPKIQEKIFTPFFTTKPSGQGTGLGLSLSHDIIVKAFRGKLTFNTKEGEYTEFIIFLPKWIK